MDEPWGYALALVGIGVAFMTGVRRIIRGFICWASLTGAALIIGWSVLAERFHASFTTGAVVTSLAFLAWWLWRGEESSEPRSVTYDLGKVKKVEVTSDYSEADTFMRGDDVDDLAAKGNVHAPKHPTCSPVRPVPLALVSTGVASLRVSDA